MSVRPFMHVKKLSYLRRSIVRYTSRSLKLKTTCYVYTTSEFPLISEVHNCSGSPGLEDITPDDMVDHLGPDEYWLISSQ